MGHGYFAGLLKLFLALCASSGFAADPQWLWRSPQATAPVNTFTYFISEFPLSSLEKELYISLAADSNAALFVNGNLLARKVTRYKESYITSDRFYLPNSSLILGNNSVVIRHFSWGNIETFQRTGEQVR